ncbi:hypothetical protein [Cellulomonas bogoriensis]|uniref:ATP synthase n=1 Tax=Cellulomonas bogoriensis 69B4 = DSM 16987 TaxID=1386082 RepID=A0A0A0C1G7_9CELL|nr:hypothetical protein [Cellulomonas bogoriensis]KGM13777.1 hypothetical protein N869_10260 [Cellulomonas bogoriensis 69B4 = DSM 16987]
MTDPRDDRPRTDGAAPTGSSPVATTSDVFRRALRGVLVLMGAVTVLGGVGGYLVAGTPGLWSALIASAVTLVFTGSTVVAMLRTARSSVTVASAALVGTWIAKMALLLVVVALLRDAQFYDRPVFGVVVLVGVIGSIWVDFRAVTSVRVPYVEPGAGTARDAG